MIHDVTVLRVNGGREKCGTSGSCAYAKLGSAGTARTLLKCSKLLLGAPTAAAGSRKMLVIPRRIGVALTTGGARFPS